MLPGCYADDMTRTPSPNGASADTAVIDPPLPTHGQGLRRFEEILECLESAGWIKYRVDTYVRPEHAREGMTVRHHYDHGTWELWFEKDRYWFPQQAPTSVRRALIRLDRPLPTVREALSQLFGRQFVLYARAEIPADREQDA